jgi:hypothetical protein
MLYLICQWRGYEGGGGLRDCCIRPGRQNGLPNILNKKKLIFWNKEFVKELSLLNNCDTLKFIISFRGQQL